MVDTIILDIETTGLEPSENGRVTCISTHHIEKNVLQTFISLNEREILEKFWAYIKNFNCPTLVTFNGSCFDIPYLIHRSVVCSQKIAKYIHLDLRQIANSFFTSYDKRAKGSLSYWAAVLGIEQKTPSGAQMVQLFLEGKLDEIEKHCVEDVLVAQKLYERLKFCELI